MSRSGYSEDLDNWSIIRWRGAVAAAIRGKHGQAFLKEMLVAFDALDKPRLIAEGLQVDGEFCALGSVGLLRKMDMSEMDPEDNETVCDAFNVTDSLGREIMYENDECSWHEETPEGRFIRMRKWVESKIKQCA